MIGVFRNVTLAIRESELVGERDKWKPKDKFIVVFGQEVSKHHGLAWLYINMPKTNSSETNFLWQFT